MWLREWTVGSFFIQYIFKMQSELALKKSNWTLKQSSLVKAYHL